MATATRIDGSFNRDPLWMSPGALASRRDTSKMPRRGYIHLDEAADGAKRASVKQARLRLDQHWMQWGRSMECAVKAEFLRLDAGETVFFMRELAEIKAQAFDVIYAELMGRKLVPVISGDPGADTFIFTQFDSAGKAKRISGAAGDSPRINVKGNQFINPYNSYGASFDYTIPELRAAAKAGRSIDALRAKACRQAIAQAQDDILALGDPDADDGSGASSPMNGLLSYCLAGMGTQSLPPASVSGSTVWIGNKTTDEIIADITNAIATLASNTKNAFQVKRAVFPIKQFAYLRGTPRSTISDTSILEWLEDNYPEIEFMDWNRLAGAGANAVAPGTAPYDMAIYYDPSPERLWCPITIEYEQLAPQLEKYTYAVYAEMRMGGVVSPYPLSMGFQSGI